MYKLTIWALVREGDKGIHQLSSRIPENVQARPFSSTSFYMKKHIKQEARSANAIDTTAHEFKYYVLCCMRKITETLVTRSN